MEIERKYLIDEIPFDLKDYSCKVIEQGYLNTDPVVRVRRSNDKYILTYKGSGLMVREEYNLPLNEEAYRHLIQKADGIIISKKRYLIPLTDRLTIELDIFEGDLAPLKLAEVEFETKEEAESFLPPKWFGKMCIRDRADCMQPAASKFQRPAVLLPDVRILCSYVHWLFDISVRFP